MSDKVEKETIIDSKAFAIQFSNDYCENRLEPMTEEWYDFMQPGWVEALAEKIAERDAIIRSNSMSEWISVKDRLPEALKCVICLSSQGKILDGFYSYEYDEWRGSDLHYRSITHWMPLPQQPVETSPEKV